jgi:hypothetical protein
MNHAPTPPLWEPLVVIDCYAPNHLVRCTRCDGPIEPGEMFQVCFGRPTHPSCPTDRSHLRLVQ